MQGRNICSPPVLMSSARVRERLSTAGGGSMVLQPMGLTWHTGSLKNLWQPPSQHKHSFGTPFAVLLVFVNGGRAILPQPPLLLQRGFRSGLCQRGAKADSFGVSQQLRDNLVSTPDTERPLVLCHVSRCSLPVHEEQKSSLRAHRPTPVKTGSNTRRAKSKNRNAQSSRNLFSSHFFLSLPLQLVPCSFVALLFLWPFVACWKPTLLSIC